MIVTVFRNRLNPDPQAQAEYQATAARMSALAQAMPGYRSHKTFVAEDGERLTLVDFESEEAQRAWSLQSEHVAAKQQGRASFYAEYSLQVCSVMRESRFPRD